MPGQSNPEAKAMQHVTKEGWRDVLPSELWPFAKQVALRASGRAGLSDTEAKGWVWGLTEHPSLEYREQQHHFILSTLIRAHPKH